MSSSSFIFTLGGGTMYEIFQDSRGSIHAKAIRHVNGNPHARYHKGYFSNVLDLFSYFRDHYKGTAVCVVTNLGTTVKKGLENIVGYD